LGLSADLRVLVPAHKHELQFGHPDHNLAERATLRLAGHLAERSEAFVDVGANEGIFTFYVACRMRGGSLPIHSFEPDRDLFDRLSTNVRRNSIAAVVNPLAVSDRNGRQTFYRDASSDLSGSLSDYFVGGHETKPTEVEVTTLESYLVGHGLRETCVKIDVEGAGALVWAGACAAASRIRWLIMEILQPEVEARLPARIIAETGWSAYYIHDYRLVHSRAGEFEYRAPFYNWLFCRLDPASLAKELAGTKFAILPAQPMRE
jgi:FkbM family methyltransferase